MGMVFHKAWTTPVPRGAEIVERDGKRIAQWRLRNGQLRSAEVVDCRDGKLRVRGQSKFYTVRYRDGRGQMVEVATRCKDVVAARAVLARLERRAELVRAGVMSEAEDCVADHVGVPLAKHLDAYQRHLKARGGNGRRISMLRARLERLFRECRFTKLSNLAPGSIEEWLVEQAESGLSASTRNGYREAAVCFGNWCRRTKRLTGNPFEDVPRADQNADRRHHRRALTTSELQRLLKAARLRPLAEYGRAVTAKGRSSKRPPRSRATWNREPLTYESLDESVERARIALADNPDFVAELERIGRERELLYKTLVLTGLRKSELASLTVGQLELNAPVAYAVLHAKDEKNRKGASVPLRADLVGDFNDWLRDRLGVLQADARQAGKAIPLRLPPNTPLFHIPSGMTRIFDRDLAVAGIPKRDERDRVVDIHALRVTFGTHLCAASVPLRTAQAAMRHSKPELTANVYTDPKLLDVAGAINALPALHTPVPDNMNCETRATKAAGGGSSY